jgi:hypothetical protein
MSKPADDIQLLLLCNRSRDSHMELDLQRAKPSKSRQRYRSRKPRLPTTPFGMKTAKANEENSGDQEEQKYFIVFWGLWMLNEQPTGQRANKRAEDSKAQWQ